MDDALEADRGTSPTMPVGGSVATAFLYWYIVIAPKNIVSIWRNYLAANLNYFSIGFLLRTLFAPWHRDTEIYGGFDLTLYLRTAIVNSVSRIVGLLIRCVTIAIGLVVEFGIVMLGPVCLALWFTAPFLLLFGLTTPAAPPSLAMPHFSIPTTSPSFLDFFNHGVR